MTKPEAIQQWAWDEAGNILVSGVPLNFVALASSRIQVAMALESAHARGVEEERNACLKDCEDQIVTFSQDEYATPQPIGGMAERFACNKCIEAIRNRGSA